MRVKRQRLRHPFRSICILLFCIPLFRYPLQMSVSFIPLNVPWDFRHPNFAVRFAHLSTSDLCCLYSPISRSSSLPCVALFFPVPYILLTYSFPFISLSTSSYFRFPSPSLFPSPSFYDACHFSFPCSIL